MDRIMDIAVDGTTLVLVGDLDVRSTGEVRAALHGLLDLADQRGEADVVVDLSGVGAVDHTALRVLAVATRRARLAGHHLWLRGCRPEVRRMLALTHLRRAVEVEAPARTVGAAGSADTSDEVSPITHRAAVTTG